MSRTHTHADDDRLIGLYREYARGEITRREFMRGATALGVGAVSASTLLQALAANSAPVAQASSARAAAQPLDIAEWSYFWVGVEQAHLARGTLVNGKQMYVEYWIPAQVRQPYPIVLVHGGGGQGLDWMGTPDGRPGWVTYLLQEGFSVYVVDRPGHGRSPFHPDLHGLFPAQTLTLESMSGQFTPPNAARPAVGPYRPLHNQWPGTGEVGSRDLDQLVASQGGSYVAAGGLPGAGAGAVAGRGGRAAVGQGALGGRGSDPSAGTGGRGAPGAAPAAAFAAPSPPVDGGTAAGGETAHMVWRQRGAMLLDKIGPAIFMTHSAGGPFGWLVAEIRPALVKGIICIEGGGAPFAGQNIWGMSTIPVAYDPPVSDPSEIKTRMVTPSEAGVQPYRLQEEPARKLKNLQGIPIVLVTAEASFASPGNPGAVAFLKQAGCRAEELRLVDHAIHGNGHMMMIEKNNRQVLQPILDWIQKNVPASGGHATTRRTSISQKSDSTAVKLADQGFFWVGTEHKKMPYGTIISGQMYVQYLIPAQVRGPYPVVLVHGGGGQMLHYMGSGDGVAGWAHYYVQQGYPVYLVDRPGHGRAPYHPDALGPIGPHATYSGLVGDLRRSAVGPNRQWPGSGDLSDPIVDQFMASQNAAPQDQVMAQRLWASRGSELLDRIGPAIVQTHSAGGPFGWLVADHRPRLVKAIVCVEGGGSPFQTPWGLTAVPVTYDPPVLDPNELETRDVHPPAGSAVQPYKLQAEPARKLKNLEGIPIVYVTAERSGRTQGPAVVAFLKQAGCDAEDLQLKDRGILGNSHFMMFENNRRQVFDVIRGWIEQKIPSRS
jgi:pimeloyl-ACP methyl ester carboxylesterase